MRRMPASRHRSPFDAFAISGAPFSGYRRVAPSVDVTKAGATNTPRFEYNRAYTSTAPITDPTVVEALYKRWLENPAIQLTNQEILNLTEMRNRVKNDVTPKRVPNTEVPSDGANRGPLANRGNPAVFGDRARALPLSQIQEQYGPPAGTAEPAPRRVEPEVLRPATPPV